MSKVKTYKGHAVPDGATCFVETGRAFKAHFGKEVDGIEYVFSIYSDHPEWHEVSNTLPLKARGAIPLPEEEDDQEWVDGLPPIGCECETTDFWNSFERPEKLADGQKVSILMNYQCPVTKTDGVIFTWVEFPDKIRTEWTGNEKHFRQLKTQEEKDREAFIEMANESIDVKEFSYSEINVVKRVIKHLANNNFTAPKGDL